MKGCWVGSLSAALLNKAMRDRLTVFFIGDHAGFDGATKTRGGLGAEFWAMTGRYSKAIRIVARVQPLLLHSCTVFNHCSSSHSCRVSIYTKNTIRPQTTSTSELKSAAAGAPNFAPIWIKIRGGWRSMVRSVRHSFSPRLCSTLRAERE